MKAFLVIVSVVASLFASTLDTSAEDAAQLWQSIRSASLDVSRAVEVDNVDVEMEPGHLKLRSGFLIPSQAQGGNPSELVFIGEGRFQITAPDDVERNQLELFTERNKLDVDVREAVVAAGNPRLVERLLSGKSAAEPDAAVLTQAEETFAAWVNGAERRGFGADAAILQSVLGDDLYQHFFVAWLRSEELGDFYYTLDPGELEQTTLGQFVPVELDDVERRKVSKSIRKAKSKGRFRQTRLEDLGDWDTWISASLRNSDGVPVPGGLGFESEHYTLEARLDTDALTIDGEATIQVRAEIPGRRVAAFSLYSNMDVRKVEDGLGQARAWARSGDKLYVVLDESTKAGDKLTFVIGWNGTGFEEIEGGTYALLDTFSWYPRIGALDRATYEATFHWPKKHTFLASGSVVDAGQEGNTRWERRTLDVPAIAFSFEVGDFAVHQTKVGHVDVTIGFGKVSGSIDKGAKEDIIESVEGSLAFLEEHFGTYPLDYLTVATVPRAFSQGYLGFVTLSHYLLWTPSGSGYYVWTDWDGPEEFAKQRRQGRIETVAHELSHQWWGNKVGWYSYRDQWLSEGLADFSATLYTAHEAERKSLYLAGHAKGWKRSVGRYTRGGRPFESLGPVVLGSRLSSSLSDDAYSAVVYDKGSVVFNMMAKTTGTETFTKMLKALADLVNNGIIDTATFIQAMGKMSGIDFQPFADQFIYGTGMPEVYYTFKFGKEEGKWIVEGQARQVSTGHFRYTLERAAEDTWDVTRTRIASMDVNQSSFVVPFQISVAGAKEDTIVAARSKRKTTTQVGLGGNMVIKGEITEFRFPLDRKPTDFWLDQRGEVLADFYSEQREPKRMMRYRAYELAGAGEYAEAIKLYEKALAAPIFGEAMEIKASKRDLELETNLQNAVIQIDLARMFIDQGQNDRAALALDKADDLLTGPDKDRYEVSREVLRCHLQTRDGDYESVFKQLSKTTYLDFPNMDYELPAEVMRRRKFRSRDRVRLSGRGYALFALAAYKTGHEEIARQAMKEAEQRGADLQSLKEFMPEGA